MTAIASSTENQTITIFQSPFLIIAFTASTLSSQFGYPIWAIWLGRRLQSDCGDG